MQSPGRTQEGWSVLPRLCTPPLLCSTKALHTTLLCSTKALHTTPPVSYQGFAHHPSCIRGVCTLCVHGVHSVQCMCCVCAVCVSCVYMVCVSYVCMVCVPCVYMECVLCVCVSFAVRACLSPQSETEVELFSKTNPDNQKF